MLYLLIIVLEIIVLLLLSKVLPSLLVALFYFFVRSHKVAVWLLSIIFLPGTLIHEMAHLLTAGVLFVNVGDISLVPQIHDEGVKLGHVEIQKTDPIRRALIGFAPVFVGLGILIGIIFYANSQFFSQGSYPFWLIGLVIYLMVVIGNTMFSSKKDLEGSFIVVVIFISILGAIYLLGFDEFFAFLKRSLIDNNLEFYKNFAYFLGLPVILDILVYLLTKMLVRRLY